MRAYTREVPPEWERALRAISPKSTAQSYLMFKWEHVQGRVKGNWVDRSRWVLYECQPAWAIHPELRRMLEDTPPRLLPLDRQRGRRMFVDDWAHEYYRVHRVFARPFWVLQGQQGGTPAGYTDREQAILKALGEPTDPPPVGSLSYCGFDWRVAEQILMRDQLLKNGMSIDAIADAKQIGIRTTRDLAEAEQEHRRLFIEWFKGTIAPSADFLTWFTRKTEADMVLRKRTDAEARAAGRFEDSYIETGLMPYEGTT